MKYSIYSGHKLPLVSERYRLLQKSAVEDGIEEKRNGLIENFKKKLQ